MSHLRRNFIAFGLFLIFIIFSVIAEDDLPPKSEEESKSSTEEIIEDPNKIRNKRSFDVPSGENNNNNNEGKITERSGIPGLPDAATILKIAEILQTLGEKVLPILLEGNSVVSLITDRVDKDYIFLKDFKNQIDSFTDELTSKK